MPSLDHHHDVVGGGRFAGPRSRNMHGHDETAGRLNPARLAGRIRDSSGQLDAERTEELVEVLAPADRDCGDGYAVLQHQAPSADPRDDFAEWRRRRSRKIRRPDRPGEFGVRQC